MRIGLIGLIVAAWLTWLGAPRLVVEIKNRTPLEQSLQEYLEQWPDNQWLTLHQCHIDLAEAAWDLGGRETLRSAPSSTPRKNKRFASWPESSMNRPSN